MNKDIKKLHQQLIKSHQTLSRQLGKTKNIEDAEAILREMEEINFRVMMAGRLLFKQTSAEITQDIEPVIAASADLDKSIKEAKQIKDIIKAVGKLLSFVDSTLDKLKLL